MLRTNCIPRAIFFRSRINMPRSMGQNLYFFFAKYGLVEENEVLVLYNQTLKGMSREERSAWAKNVLENIEREGDILSDRFIILAGDLYYRDWIDI